MKSKKYFYDYEDYEEGNKDAQTLAQEILEDSEAEVLDEIIVGCFGECWENGCQPIIDMFVENNKKFSNLKSLFIGDMDYEECEVSWIEQGDYSKLWDAMPNLESLTIKGSTGLSLGDIKHDKLKSLEIICGGLPQKVMIQIAQSNLPNLEKLNLYLGVDDYGFDGDINDIENILRNSSFKNLKYLGLGDSEIQDEVVCSVLKSDIVKQLKTLDFSNGTLSDVGGQAILDNKDKLINLEKLDLHYNFMSDSMLNKLNRLNIEVDTSEQEKNDEEYGNYPMLTE